MFTSMIEYDKPTYTLEETFSYLLSAMAFLVRAGTGQVKNNYFLVKSAVLSSINNPR